MEAFYKEPLISIIVPIYNVAPYIERCCISLLSQTYKNIEYIFVNDCTKDQSMDILEKVISTLTTAYNIKIITHDVNKGLAEARNTGVNYASGDYIMHVDSDDYIEINAVSEIVRVIQETSADAVLFGMRHVFKSKDYVYHISIPNSKEVYLKQLIVQKQMVCIWGGAYKRSLYDDYNIRAIPGLNMGEDYSTKPRLLYNAQKIVAIDLPLYNYIHYNESSYTSNFSQKNIKNLNQAIEVVEEYYKGQPDFSVYKESFVQAKTQAFIKLLNSWGISKAGPEELKMLEIFYSYIDNNYIPWRYVPVAYLFEKRLYTLLRWYVRLGFKLTQSIK